MYQKQRSVLSGMTNQGSVMSSIAIILLKLDDKYRPDRCVCGYENQEKDQLWLVSRDRTLPPEIQTVQ